MSINVWVGSGNLTRDGELRSTNGGTAVLGFGVAVNERKKNSQTGEWEDVAQFIECTMFGNRASGLAPYLTKGTKVFIQGHLRYSQWQAQDGSKRSKLEVIVDEIEFMAPRASQTPQQPAYQQQPAQYPQQGQPPAYGPQGAPQGYQQMAQPAQMAQQMAQQAQPMQQQMPMGTMEVYADEEIPF